MREERIFDAVEFAAKAHRGHYRKGTKVPYLIHLLNVAKILINLEAEEEVIIAGLLHDTIEDTNVTIEEIRSEFGDKVAELVLCASEPVKSDTWENRKSHTIVYLKTCPRDVLLLACADKLDNIRSIKEEYKELGDAVWKRFSRPREKQEWYYRSLTAEFGSRAWDKKSEELFSKFRSEVEEVFNS